MVPLEVAATAAKPVEVHAAAFGFAAKPALWTVVSLLVSNRRRLPRTRSRVARGSDLASNGRMAGGPSIQELLQRWHAGDVGALEQLVEASLPWLRQYTEKRLGGFLRGRADANDYLHDALLDFLRDGPRFVVGDERQFRGLLVRVIENTLRDKNDWFRAKRRNLGQAAVQATDSVLDLQRGGSRPTTPSGHVAREEGRAWVRLALELLEPEDRKIILGRDYEQRSFVEIGEELGITAAAVRMRWTRAIGRLGQTMLKLRAGDVDVPEDGRA